MTSPSLLNLDDFVSTPIKTITIAGVSYPAEDLSVEQYVARVKENRSVDGNASEPEKIDHLIWTIRGIFPTLPEEVCRKLKLSQLNKLIGFALKTPDDIATKVRENTAPVEETSESESTSGNG